MRRALALLALSVAAFGAEKPHTFVGKVVDNQCGENCARECPLVKGIRYTFQTDEEAFVITDQKKAAPFAGKEVRIEGKLTNSNRLIIRSITPEK
jgi:hypothetical protein